MERPRACTATSRRRCSMARKRASMREGPLAELFRATEAAQRQAEGQAPPPEPAPPLAPEPELPPAAVASAPPAPPVYESPPVTLEPEPAQSLRPEVSETPAPEPTRWV